MKYRNVGKAGIKVSEIALGSWMTDLKESSEEDVAKEVVKLAYENGINFFDCADAYSGGAAERFFGEVLKEFPRKDLVISSKVYFPTGDGVNDRGLSRKHIMENCEQSLKNMNLDYLDLYYCHRYDENTDLEETLRAMSDLVAQGKVLYYGVSEEWGSARIEEAQKIIDKRGLYPITVIQPQYNMVDRYIEHEIMGTCRKYGIGITSFSPLSQGLLTGKYKKGQPYPEGSRATHQADKQITEITCHARGAAFLNPSIRAIVDIGGQDCKAILLDNGLNVVDFIMNDKCAAGTGRFLEMMAKTLGLSLEEMSVKGLEWKHNIVISSMCTVFAESEVVSLVAQNKDVADIIHGLNVSVASKVGALAARLGKDHPGEYMMTGGVAKNRGIIQALEEKLGAKLYICDEAQLCGALGAALFAYEKCKGSAEETR